MPDISLQSSHAPVDLLIVGGGINGCGVARDAAGRGLATVLCERDDLGGATSAASSKLLHGGLRYLERYDFRLVREALIERETLLRIAPQIAWPLRFVLPHHAGLRPAWMLRLGLFLYDHLHGRSALPRARSIALAQPPLHARYRRGFAYWDGWVDDSRLVVLTALDAAERGARILTRTRFVSARRDAGLWHAVLEGADGARKTIAARALVNAAGPWVNIVGDAIGATAPAPKIKLVKGSHIVVPRLYDGDHAYTLQGGDGRVVFTIPYEGQFTLVGTTDVTIDRDMDSLAASSGEIAYLCRTLADYFTRTIEPDDVVWSFAGVRPLLDDGHADASAVTRDYRLILDARTGAAPLLTIVGGKLTTHRRLAERVLHHLQTPLGIRAGDWTAAAPLPGGDMPAGFAAFRVEAGRRWPWIPDADLTRLCRAYGTRLDRMLGHATGPADMGRAFGAGLSEREIAYLRDTEWAMTTDDILWRRTKLGLHMTAVERDAVALALEPSATATAGG